MGTLGGGNGGERPSDGGNRPDGLPGLPPEWGRIVIPDDPAELAEEAAEIRRELRREARRRRIRRLLRLPARPDPDEQSIRIPLVIMAIAIVAALTSLFAVAWPGSQGDPYRGRPAGPVADLTFVDADGAEVRLRDVLPAAIVLVEGCECNQFLADVSVAAGDRVPVLAVAPVLPSVAPQPGGATGGSTPPGTPRSAVRALADPSDALRTRLGLPAPNGSASVVLVSRSGQIVRMIPRARSVDQFRLDLLSLR